MGSDVTGRTPNKGQDGKMWRSGSRDDHLRGAGRPGLANGFGTDSRLDRDDNNNDKIAQDVLSTYLVVRWRFKDDILL